jgi:hypothetical protein
MHASKKNKFDAPMFEVSIFTSILLVVGVIAPISLTAQNTSGCSNSPKVKVTRQKGEHPLPIPSPGKAMVFIVRPESDCDNLSKSSSITGFSINGKWTGMVSGQSYSYFEVDPGLLEVCARDLGSSWGSPSEHQRTKKFVLDVAAGHIYYLRTNSNWCGYRYRVYTFNVVPMDDAKAQIYIKRLDYISWEIRMEK